jgi:peptidoglycan/xylan/chitin deacetylase (PgdA/CDA1 family)
MRWRVGVGCVLVGLMASSFGPVSAAGFGDTRIAKWRHGRRAAVSLTYDDGSLNQFRVAVPIMNEMGLPATFFIITGAVRGSRYPGAFIGRPTDAIVAETAKVPTGKDNFFERASAIAHLGLEGTSEYHSRAGELYEEGKAAEAYRLLDEAYAKVRAGAFGRSTGPALVEGDRDVVTWDDLGALAREGHEIASHTVTHPRLAVLDEPNLAYELEKSRGEILDHLGPKQTFTVECPYGTEDERAVAAALARYPASRNRMPEPFLEELDRGSDQDPSASRKEYVQWQRGALTRTPMATMKSWVDKVAALDHAWLVLVFHGVDGVGWEPKTGADLREYFGYIKSREQDLWVATFQDVTKYMREREHGRVEASLKGDVVEVALHHDLDGALYDVPLTLRTTVPPDWRAVEARQGSRVERVEVVREGATASVTYDAAPNAEALTLTRKGP